MPCKHGLLQLPLSEHDIKHPNAKVIVVLIVTRHVFRGVRQRRGAQEAFLLLDPAGWKSARFHAGATQALPKPPQFYPRLRNDKEADSPERGIRFSVYSPLHVITVSCSLSRIVNRTLFVAYTAVTAHRYGVLASFPLRRSAAPTLCLSRPTSMPFSIPMES